MGNWNSGRRPTPTALKILRGNPGKRRIPAEPEQEPPADGFAEPPPELRGDARARAEWNRVAPILVNAGIVSEADRSTLTALCLEWSTYLEARHQLRTKGRVLTTKSGPRISPYIKIADMSLSHCQRLWIEFGLTPSGRVKVSRIPLGRLDPASASPPRGKWAGTGL